MQLIFTDGEVLYGLHPYSGIAQMRQNNKGEERTFDSSVKRAFCARETPFLKNFCKNSQMNMNFRDFLRLDK